MAIRILEKWKQENWPSAIYREIRHLKVEPNNDIKEDITRLLNGQELN